jgi:hypothetical protein
MLPGSDFDAVSGQFPCPQIVVGSNAGEKDVAQAAITPESGEPAIPAEAR